MVPLDPNGHPRGRVCVLLLFSHLPSAHLSPRYRDCPCFSPRERKPTLFLCALATTPVFTCSCCCCYCFSVRDMKLIAVLAHLFLGAAIVSKAANAERRTSWENIPSAIAACDHYPDDEVKIFNTLTVLKGLSCEKPLIFNIHEKAVVQSDGILDTENVYFIVHKGAKLTVRAEAIHSRIGQGVPRPVFLVMGEIEFHAREWMPAHEGGTPEDKGRVIVLKDGGSMFSNQAIVYTANSVMVADVSKLDQKGQSDETPEVATVTSEPQAALPRIHAPTDDDDDEITNNKKNKFHATMDDDKNVHTHAGTDDGDNVNVNTNKVNNPPSVDEGGHNNNKDHALPDDDAGKNDDIHARTDDAEDRIIINNKVNNVHARTDIAHDKNKNNNICARTDHADSEKQNNGNNVHVRTDMADDKNKSSNISARTDHAGGEKQNSGDNIHARTGIADDRNKNNDIRARTNNAGGKIDKNDNNIHGENNDDKAAPAGPKPALPPFLSRSAVRFLLNDEPGSVDPNRAVHAGGELEGSLLSPDGNSAISLHIDGSVMFGKNPVAPEVAAREGELWGSNTELLSSNKGKARKVFEKRAAAFGWLAKHGREKDEKQSAVGGGESENAPAEKRREGFRRYFPWGKSLDVQREEALKAVGDIQPRMTMDNKGCVAVSLDDTCVLRKSGPRSLEFLNRFPFRWRETSDDYKLVTTEDGMEVRLGDKTVWGVTAEEGSKD